MSYFPFFNVLSWVSNKITYWERKCQINPRLFTERLFARLKRSSVEEQRPLCCPARISTKKGF